MSYVHVCVKERMCVIVILSVCACGLACVRARGCVCVCVCVCVCGVCVVCVEWVVWVYVCVFVCIHPCVCVSAIFSRCPPDLSRSCHCSLLPAMMDDGYLPVSPHYGRHSLSPWVFAPAPPPWPCLGPGQNRPMSASLTSIVYLL